MKNPHQESQLSFKVPALDIFLAFARALDLPHPSCLTHHTQTAYLAFLIAQKMDIPKAITKDLVIAALVHDLGAVGEEDEPPYEFIKPSLPPSLFHYRHSILGYALLEEYPLFRELAPNMGDMILYHHFQWKMINEPEPSKLPSIFFIKRIPRREILLSSFIIHLAGEVSRAIDRKKTDSRTEKRDY